MIWNKLLQISLWWWGNGWICDVHIVSGTCCQLDRCWKGNNNKPLQITINSTFSFSLNATTKALGMKRVNLLLFTGKYWKGLNNILKMKIWRYILALKFAFVIIFEHFVFGICKLIDVMVPDIPYSLDIKIKRERYLAKQALQVSIDNLAALVGLGV